MRIRIENILLTSDLSESSKVAIAYGVALAREYGSKLFLCHVIDLPSTGIYGDAISYPVGQQDRVVSYTHQHLNQLMADWDADWEPVITIGHPPTEIVRLAKSKRIDLVISATHGRSGWKRFLLGSVTGRLMRALPCPLLLVRSSDQATKPPTREISLKRILVGCDFSPDSGIALQYGLSLAQEFQSELHLAHVIAPPIYEDLTKRSTGPEREYQEDLRVMLKERLNELVPEEAHNWCVLHITLLAGQPYEELVKYAVVHDIELLVLGLRGQSLMETLFVGSTADRVARESPCPVLLIRPIAKIE
ncbi:MAG: universal stress protein [Deltaproteobacteria bacterium]|nr:universal stress protein [Deltaproteobacteria bacterium]MBW2136006.1 universal stress protein [Deltaproteobacteria bacterium]